VSCGTGLTAHRHPADKRAAMALFSVDADPYDVIAWLWDDETCAAASARLNRDAHGHGDAVHGPAATEAGWVTLVDLRPALARVRAETGL
jgi:hypothetical protein